MHTPVRNTTFQVDVLHHHYQLYLFDMSFSITKSCIRLLLALLAICSVLFNQLYVNVPFSRELTILQTQTDEERTILRSLGRMLPDTENENEVHPILRNLIKINADGSCTWVEPTDVNQDPNYDLFSTLLVSYPGSAKRAAHMQMAGLTERTTRDDFYLNPDSPVQRYAFFKTQYPHHEGIWSWGNRTSQSIYVLQNPRMALITYHFILAEIYFSTSWQTSYNALSRVFTMHAPVEGWQRWRDIRFKSEIRQWSWHLDFWMEGGLMRDFYTHELTTSEHFVRLMAPERFSEGELRAYQAKLSNVQPAYDNHCAGGSIQSGCRPVAITSFEGIMNEATGPQEASKLAAAIENKAGIDVIAQHGRECAWRKIVVERVTGVRDDRDRVGPSIDNYVFTREEMLLIIEELERVRDKYTSSEWASNTVAQDIVGYMEEYIVDNQGILDLM